MPFDVYLNVAVGGVLTGLVYGLMALGLSVIFGVVRVVNFAHGEMMTIAMFIAVLAFASLHLDPLVLLVPIAAVMFVFGYVLQRGLINPFITRPEHTQFLLLVALGIIIANVLLILFGPDARSVQTSYSYDSFQVGPLIVDAAKVYAAAAAIVFTAALFAFFRFTLVGKAIRAVSQDKATAALMGIGVNRIIAITFAIGSVMAAVGGMMVGAYFDAVYPLMGWTAGIKAFTAAVLGGVGSIPGAMVAGVLIGLVETLGSAYISSGFRDGFAFIILILTLLFMPSGLFKARKGEGKV